MGDGPPAAGAAPRRRRRFQHHFVGTGLEIGALHHPTPVNRLWARVRYVDRLSLEEQRRHYPELAAAPLVRPDIVAEADRLTPLADGSQDFVIASHLLEHLEDPIAAFEEWHRVLRPGGVLFLAVPDMRRTFDRDRPRTTLAHLVADHRDGGRGSRAAHYLEYARLVDRRDGQAAEDQAQAYMARGYSIHFHVWRPDDLDELLDHLRDAHGLRWRVVKRVETPESDEFIFILRKDGPRAAAPRGRERGLVLGGMLLAVVATAGYAYLARGTQLDDALIYYRYIANALEGRGLVYNPGERYNALTSPLYTYLSIGLAALVQDIQASQIALGALFLAATAVTVILTFARQGMAGAGLVAGLGLATHGFFYLTLGLETTLFLFLLSAAILAWLEERTMLAAVAAALLVLTRGEGVFLLGILLALHWRRHRRLPPVRVGAAVAALLLAPAVFNLAYYGSPVPHTLAAKIQQGRSGLWGDGWLFLNVGYLYRWFATENPWLLALPALLAACSIPEWVRRPHLAALLLYVAAYSLFYLVLNVPPYLWYYAIHFYAATVLAAYGVRVVTGGLGGRTRGPVRAAALALGLGLAIGLIAVQAWSSRQLRAAAPPPAYKAIGEWLREHTPADSAVACVEVGAIGWYSRRPIVDILGLVSPHNAALLGRRDFAGWTHVYRPEYILVHEPRWPAEQGVRALLDAGTYARVPTFPFEGYALLAKAP
ncbi:MAG: class I SAM-dependent methyltransferase [Candidatus Rokuibacteriota bacterium]